MACIAGDLIRGNLMVDISLIFRILERRRCTPYEEVLGTTSFSIASPASGKGYYHLNHSNSGI